MNTEPKNTTSFSVKLTKEDSRSLNALAEYFGETKRDIIKRGLILLDYITFSSKGETK